MPISSEFIVIALSDSVENPPLRGCSIVSREVSQWPQTMAQTFGPSTFQECVKFVERECLQEGPGQKHRSTTIDRG
jgi:hypothetical protein